MTKAKQAIRILVADDQHPVLDALEMLLRNKGFRVDCARSPHLALEYLSLSEYDTMLLDLNYAGRVTSGRNGIDLLPRIRAIDSRGEAMEFGTVKHF